jgi:hypothetical protein
MNVQIGSCTRIRKYEVYSIHITQRRYKYDLYTLQLAEQDKG